MPWKIVWTVSVCVCMPEFVSFIIMSKNQTKSDSGGNGDVNSNKDGGTDSDTYKDWDIV